MSRLLSALRTVSDNDLVHDIASGAAKVCDRCGIHIDELRPPDDDPVNLQGSGPAPIARREG